MSSGGSEADPPVGPSAEGSTSAEWRRIYDRVVALLPQVEALAADRARLEATNKSWRELSESRHNALHARLHQAEASRERWKTAYIQLPLLANSKTAEHEESDLVHSKACEAPFEVDNSRPKIQSKEDGNIVEISQENADHGGIAGDLRAELAKLKQAYMTLSSNKDKEISASLAVKDFLWNQLRRMDKDNAGLLEIKQVEAAQANKAAQKLQQNVEELQLAVRNKDCEIGRLRAEAGLLNIKEVEAAEANKAAQKLQQNVEELQLVVRNKDDEIGRLQAEAGLLKIKEVEAAQANKAAQKLQQNVEELQLVVRNKDDEIGRLQAEVGLLKIKEVEAAEANKAAQKLQQKVEVLQVAVRNKDDEICRLRAEDGKAKKGH